MESNGNISFLSPLSTSNLPNNKMARPTSRSDADLDTSEVTISRSKMLKSSLAELALEGMNLSLNVTRDLGDQMGTG
jgi:hypothetical protein